MKDKQADLKRRHFLLSLGAGTAGAAATVVAVAGKGTPAVTGGPRAAAEAGPERGVTEHMRNYYRSARV